jgi:hypothetical protein
MRLLIPFAFFSLLGCSSGQNKLDVQTDTTKTSIRIDTPKASAKIDTTTEYDNGQVEAREDLIASYEKPIFIDTFFVDNGKKFEVFFHYWCTMDSSILVPAKYNFDTNKDFVTHNFISDLVVLSDKDTMFKKRITKSTFDTFLDNSLRKYATLFDPNFYIKNDSIQIDYSISIPVTDVGVGVNIKFDKKGKQVIGQ